MKIIFWMFLFASFSAEAQLSLRNSLHQEITSPYQISAQYSVGSDLLDQVRPRRMEHDLSVNTIYNWSEHLRSGALADISYFSFDNQVVETQQGYGSVQPSISFFTTYSLKTPYVTSHNIGVSYYLPLDEYSRLEGYKGSGSLSTTFVQKIIPKLTYIQGFRGSYLFNTFDKTAAGTPNRTYSVSASPMLSWSMFSKLSLLLGFGVRWGQFTDGNNDYSYNNSQTLSYSYKNISAFVSHINGGYTENGDIYLWYIDKNRNYFTAGISYDF